MPFLSEMKSIAWWIASQTGYPSAAQQLINAVGRDNRLEIAETATIERGVELRGNITVKSGVRIENGSRLQGDISIARNGRIRRDAWIDGRVSIGRGSNLSERTEVLAARGDKITIGNYSLIARRTTFQNRYHNTDKPSMQQALYRELLGNTLEETSKGPIRIGSDVWVGKNATVLSGVEIGHGAILGADAVITHDVPSYAVVAGIPAELRDWRFDEPTREQLLDIQWWNWDEETIKQNEKFFQTNLQDISDLYTIIN